MCFLNEDWAFLNNQVFIIFSQTDTIKPPGISAISSQSCVLCCYLPEGISLQSGFFVEQLRVNSDYGWIRLNEHPIQTTNYHADGLMPGRNYKFRIVIEEKKFHVIGQETQEIEAIGKYICQLYFVDQYNNNATLRRF